MIKKKFFGKKLNHVIKINSLNSGVFFDSLKIPEISKILYSKIFEISREKNTLIISKNQVKAFFYILLEPEHSNFSILCLFEFKTKNSDLSQRDWASMHGLGLKDCCFRHFLAKENVSFKNLAELETVLNEGTNCFCYFPKNFVLVKASAWTYLLNSEDLNVLKKFSEMNFCLPEIETKNIFGGSPKNLFFSYPRKFSQKINKNFDWQNMSGVDLKAFIRSKLENFQDGKPNCQDLFLNLNINNETFQDFISGCLETIQKNNLFVQKINKHIPIKSRLLFCSFFF